MRETRGFISGYRKSISEAWLPDDRKRGGLGRVFGRANANMASQTKSEFTKKIITLRSSRRMGVLTPSSTAFPWVQSCAPVLTAPPISIDRFDTEVKRRTKVRF